MRKAALRAASVLLLGAGALCAGVWHNRAKLSYNAQGRFFDAEQGVVYTEQSASFYGALAIIMLLLSAACWALTRNT